MVCGKKVNFHLKIIKARFMIGSFLVMKRAFIMAIQCAFRIPQFIKSDYKKVACVL